MKNVKTSYRRIFKLPNCLIVKLPDYRSFILHFSFCRFVVPSFLRSVVPSFFRLISFNLLSFNLFHPPACVLWATDLPEGGFFLLQYLNIYDVAFPRPLKQMRRRIAVSPVRPYNYLIFKLPDFHFFICRFSFIIFHLTFFI